MLLAVPCSEADTVALFDAATGADAGRVSVGSHPVHLAAADGRVLVATLGERSIDVITEGTTERVSTGVLGPSHFAVTDRRAFVPCTGGDAVAVVNLETLELQDRIAVGAEPHDAELVDDVVYVGSRGDGTLSVIDTDTAAIRQTIRVGDVELGTNPRIQGITGGDSGVYAVDQANSCVLLLAESGVVAKAPVGADPYEPVLVDSRVLVPGRGDGTVTTLSRDLSTTTTHAVGGRPVDLIASEGTVWVVDRDRPTLGSLDGHEIALPYPSFAITSDPDQSSRVYLSHYDDDAVSAVDLASGTVEWTVETPARPFEPMLV